MELLVTGGGRHNLAMMAELERVMPDASVDGIEAIGEDADSKEAFDFAGLGWLRVCHERAGCDAYTGSRAAAVLGSIHFPDAGALR